VTALVGSNVPTLFFLFRNVPPLFFLVMNDLNGVNLLFLII
jgi:hypothetical protein